MQFEEGYIYHIYNQGNNRQDIFFNRKNYLYFLQKINTYILPYADILAWCLMPNHFHLMVLVNDVELGIDTEGFFTKGFAESETLGENKRTFNFSIGLLLRTYTNAINKQENRSGSLFRKETKAECVNCSNGISPSFIIKNSITQINIVQAEKQYPQVCFNYIHQNPTKAGLVQHNEDWEFSSARDYLNLRKGKLINKNTAREYVKISQ